MLYFANPSGEKTLNAMRDGRLGFIDTPAQGNRRPDGVAWCADNGCFSDKWDEDKWWSFLVRNAHHAPTCLFAVAPDVVGDAVGTAKKSSPWLGRIRELGYPVGFVAQDGQENLPVPWDQIDCLFIGGTTEWKLGEAVRGLVSEAKRRGKWVHMGRVNSKRRYEYARIIGCDSVDGTFLTFGPEVNLPKLLGWIDGAGQGILDFTECVP